MFGSASQSVIFIDEDLESIRYYKNKSSNDFKNLGLDEYGVMRFKGGLFQDGFYKTIKEIISLLCLTEKDKNKVCIVLPNLLFFSDTFKLPYLNKKALANYLNVQINNNYKNRSELIYKEYMLGQNKQYALVGIVGVKKSIIEELKTFFQKEGVDVNAVTFAASALTSGAIAINGKIKNNNCVLVDVKDNMTKFAFVIGGRTVGFYCLPFGYFSLSDSQINSEFTLFDHTSGDLLVLNAVEKAKKKQITTFESFVSEDDDFDDESEEGGESVKTDPTEIKSSFINKRINKKFPKFMLRPEPQDGQGYIYENFRIILKWTLELIASNKDYSLEEIKNVYINMPSEFNFLFDMISEESGVAFYPLASDKNGEEYKPEMELFGGLFLKKYNKVNNF